MNTYADQKTINIAPINLASHDEVMIRHALQAADGSSPYVLLNNKSARDAEILLVNLNSSNLDRTHQLIRKVYGEKTTVFIVQDDKPVQNNGYKYVIERKDLDQTILKMLDTVSREELDAELRAEFSRPSEYSFPPKSSRPETAATEQTIGRVLVVDDSPSVRTQMKLYLSKRRLDCDLVESSEAAMRAVKSRQYDIIFLDIVMPGADGYQACKAIKSLEATKRVPVILLTSKNSPIDKIHGIMSGCDKYLTKPVRSSELNELLCSYFPSLKHMVSRT